MDTSLDDSPPVSHASSAASTSSARRLIADRIAGVPAWVLLTQLFIGLGWLRAVGEKVIDSNWWSGAAIEQFVRSHRVDTLRWYEPFLDAIVSENTVAVALVVVVAQLIAGLSLVSGRHLGVGLSIGMFLNLHFLAAGAVTPSAFYLLSQGALLLWLAEGRPSLRTRTALLAVAGVGIFVAAMNVPSISTIHPSHVIEDPAVMFVFGGTLTCVACLVAAEPTDGAL